MIQHRFQASINAEKVLLALGFPVDTDLLDIRMDHASGHVRLIATSPTVQPDPLPAPVGADVPLARRRLESVPDGDRTYLVEQDWTAS